MCLRRNTKRGSADALSLQGIVSLEVSYVSNDDRFAALQILRPKGGKGCRPSCVA